MLRLLTALSVLALVWGSSLGTAAAHELPYEFKDTHVALSIDRFMGIDYTDFEGPGGGDVSARFLLNASEPVPTSFARFGFDVFIKRLSLGLSGGVTSKDVGIIAPRIGYLFGLTPQIGLWLRGGGFYAAAGPHYVGFEGDVLLEWFPFSRFALHLGPTFDAAFANNSNPNYINIGILDFGMTAWL
jgi:hypothetical protein